LDIVLEAGKYTEFDKSLLKHPVNKQVEAEKRLCRSVSWCFLQFTHRGTRVQKLENVDMAAMQT
jgi:hypothetical protein